MVSLERKIRTLLKNPRGAMKKYFIIYFLRRVPPRGEDFNRHWKYLSFVDKTVLDLGADYGSTVEYFLRNGARKIIAVEGTEKYASKLYRFFGKNKRVVCIRKWIAYGKDISQLIEKYLPDIVKIDIEGEEKCLLDVDIEALVKVKEWLVETHTEQLYRVIKDFFVQNKFRVSTIEYGKTFKVPMPEIKVLIAKG